MSFRDIKTDKLEVVTSQLRVADCSNALAYNSTP